MRPFYVDSQESQIQVKHFSATYCLKFYLSFCVPRTGCGTWQRGTVLLLSLRCRCEVLIAAVWSAVQTEAHLHRETLSRLSGPPHTWEHLRLQPFHLQQLQYFTARTKFTSRLGLPLVQMILHQYRYSVRTVIGFGNILNTVY